MTLALAVTTLGVPETEAAHAFHTAAFAPSSDPSGRHANLDMGGSGRFRLQPDDELAVAVPAPVAGPAVPARAPSSTYPAGSITDQFLVC